jgi:pimeloyl-ACP methyl ester carboxylesterase
MSNADNLCELVHVRAQDGVSLHGAYQTPTKTRSNGAYDVAILMHGAGANFYGNRFFEKASRVLRANGIHLLKVNNRGHDLVYAASQRLRTVWQGGAFEKVDEARLDMAAWLEFAAQRGWKRVLLVGHSLGALKILLTQAFHPSELVKGAIACSPPCLSYQRFMASKARDRFQKSFVLAQQQVADGRAEQLIQVDFPFPLWISASNYIDKYGPEERYNILRFTDMVEQPTLLIFGEKELAEHISFLQLDVQLNALLEGKSHFTLKSIPGADHFYSGTDDLLASEIEAWITRPLFSK